MNKQLIITMVAVLLVVGLSGCIGEESKFQGTWIGNTTLEVLSIPYEVTELTFSDNKVYMTFGVVSTTVSGTYETEGNKLLIQIPNWVSFTLTYEFKNDALYLNGNAFMKQ